MILRPATIEDSPALARVHIQSWRETYAGIVSAEFLAQMSIPKREEGWRAMLESPGDRFDLVVEMNGQIAGFCSGGPMRVSTANTPFSIKVPDQLKSSYDGEFYAAYLLREHQRQGVGRAMFEAICAELRRRGFQSMLVWVLQGNPAMKFYEAMGGREVGRTKIMIDREHEEVAYGWEKI